LLSCLNENQPAQNYRDGASNGSTVSTSALIIAAIGDIAVNTRELNRKTK